VFLRPISRPDSSSAVPGFAAGVFWHFSLWAFESIRRFKGLERPVIIVCELDQTGDRFDQLLYTGMTRTTAYLVVIAARDLAHILRRVV